MGDACDECPDTQCPDGCIPAGTLSGSQLDDICIDACDEYTFCESDERCISTLNVGFRYCAPDCDPLATTPCTEGLCLHLWDGDEDDPTLVVARARVESDVPIRIDSRARLEPQGITGLNYILITAGTPGQPLLQDAQPDVKVRRIPTERSKLSDPAGQNPAMVAPNQTTPTSMMSIKGAPTVKVSWKTRYMSMKKMGSPTIRWVTMASILSDLVRARRTGPLTARPQIEAIAL